MPASPSSQTPQTARLLWGRSLLPAPFLCFFPPASPNSTSLYLSHQLGASIQVMENFRGNFSALESQFQYKEKFFQIFSISFSMIAFCMCSLFSAWSKTTDCLPSITSFVISSPLCAGRQCITMQSFFACDNNSSFTWNGMKAFVRSAFSSSRPIEIQVSVYTTSAPPTPCAGSLQTSTFPYFFASCRYFWFGWYPLGQTNVTSIPAFAHASMSEFAMLNPQSPTKANLFPALSLPFSAMVSRSDSAWQGCSSSVRAFITGTPACLAISSKSVCLYNRAIMMFTYLPRVLAVSCIVSPRESWEVVKSK